MKNRQTNQRAFLRSLEDINAGFIRMNNNFDKLIDCEGRTLKDCRISKVDVSLYFSRFSTLQNAIIKSQEDPKVEQRMQKFNALNRFRFCHSAASLSFFEKLNAFSGSAVSDD